MKSWFSFKNSPATTSHIGLFALAGVGNCWSSYWSGLSGIWQGIDNRGSDEE